MCEFCDTAELIQATAHQDKSIGETFRVFH